MKKKGILIDLNEMNDWNDNNKEYSSTLGYIK